MSEGTHTNNLLPPFSGKLKKDVKIKYSKVKLKEKIMFWLKKERYFDKTKIDKLKVVANYPALHIFAKLAKKAYENYDKKYVKKYEEDLPEGWKLLTTASNDERYNGYYGAAYLNLKQQQVIIAHRGTNPFKFGPVWTDAKGIVCDIFVAQMNSASTFSDWVTGVLNEVNKENQINFQLFFTGHSLGGWLAQITTFTVKYLALNHDESLFEITRGGGYHAHAVVFESPGCRDMLNEMQDAFAVRYDNHHALPIDITSLDITSYLSAPNRINTCNHHLGTIYRIFIDLSDLTWREKIIQYIFPIYSTATHNMDRILKTFDQSQDFKIKEIVDWPICKLLRTEELSKFLKWAKQFNNYELDVNSEDFQAEISGNHGHCPIRYQDKAVEENKCSVNVFSQQEQLFLGRYQQLRNLLFHLKPDIFSDINDEDARNEITGRLKSFEIVNKNISCNNKEELQKFIPFVNALLYFFPEFQDKIDNALNATGIDSHSQNYHENVCKDFPHFTDDEELKTLIRNIKQVSLISDNEYTSLGFARICKAFKENATHETAKHVTLSLEGLLYLKKLLSNFKEAMTNFVEDLSKNKSLILIECTLNFNVEHNKEFTRDFFNCIFKIFKTQSESKIILVTDSRNKNTLHYIVHSITEELELVHVKPLRWNNLSNEFQEEISKRSLIVFEKQKETSLRELIGENNAFYTEIVSNQEILMKLINNEMIVIENKSPIPNDFDASCYMERKFNYKVQIKINHDKNGNNDLLVNSATDKDEQESEIHAKEYSETELLNESKDVMIIADKAGSGKSTILTNLEQKIKERDPGLLLIRVDLNDYTSKLEDLNKKGGFKSQDSNENMTAAIQFLTLVLLNIDKSFKVLFHHYCLGNIDKLVVMFDGFDEISPDYETVVIELVQALRKCKIKQIWITTRLNMRTDLENAFQRFAYSLKPFSTDEQENFLTKLWQKSENLSNEMNKDKLQIFAHALIEELATSISDTGVSFTGIPLQTRMLAEAFENEVTEFCESKETEPQISEKRDLIDLYELFFKRKHEMFHKNKNKSDLSKPGIKTQFDESYLKFIKQHQNMALGALFNEEKLKILLNGVVCEEIRKAFPDLDEDIFQNVVQKDMNTKLQSIKNDITDGNVRIGIIDQIIDDIPHFIHRTFAEYLVAKYFESGLENDTVAEFLMTTILTHQNYHMVRIFLNDLLEKKKVRKNEVYQTMLKCFGEQIIKILPKVVEYILPILNMATVEFNLGIMKFVLNSFAMHENVFKFSLKENILKFSLDENVFKFSVDEYVYKFSMDENVFTFFFGEQFFKFSVDENVLKFSSDVNVLKFCSDENVLKFSQDGNVWKFLTDEKFPLFFNVYKLLLNKSVFKFLQDTNLFKYLYDNTCMGKFTVLHHSIVNGMSEVHETVVWLGVYLDKSDVMKYLEDKGVAKNNDGSTLLEIACVSDKQGVIQYLVDNALDVNTCFSKLCKANYSEYLMKYLSTFDIDLLNEELLAGLEDLMKAFLDVSKVKELFPGLEDLMKVFIDVNKVKEYFAELQQELENEENDSIFDDFD